jgi:hypothetical protein
MSLIFGTLIYWGNTSKLRQTIKASSIYNKGKENVVVDALSCKYEDEGSLFYLSFIVLDCLQAVR